jgi:transposase
MPMTYSKEYKQAAVQKLLGRGNRSLDEVREQLGISKTSVTRWISEFGRMSGTMDEKAQGKRSQDYTAEQKCDAVMEFRRLKADPQAQGEFLRKQGLHSAPVETWEKETLHALEKQGVSRRPKRTRDEIERDEKIERTSSNHPTLSEAGWMP